MNPLLAYSDTVDAMTKVFTVLTFAAGAVVVLALLLGLVSLVPKGRERARWVVRAVGPWAGLLAWVIAIVATLGSLYYSEIAGFEPCLLCWYQRICMYPLAAILGVGWLRRDPGVRWYALPFLLVGPGISSYHWLIERYPDLGGAVECSATVRCTVPYFEELGFVTLAFMATSAFLAIGALLLVERAFDRMEVPAA